MEKKGGTGSLRVEAGREETRMRGIKEEEEAVIDQNHLARGTHK